MRRARSFRRRHVRGPTLLSLVLLFCTGGVLAAQVGGDALIRAGRDAFAAGLADVALRSFREYLLTTPNGREADYASVAGAIAALTVDRPDSAVALLEGFERRFPGSAHADGAAYWLAQAYLRQGRAGAAAAQLTPVAGSAGPYRLDALQALADAYELLEQPDAARSVLQAEMDAFPQAATAEVRYRMGSLALSAGNCDAAVAAFGELVLRHPSSPIVADALFGSGECFYLAEDWQEAADRYQRLLALFPGSSFEDAALVRLARIDFERGDPQAALTRIERLQAAGSPWAGSAAALLVTADAALVSGDFRRAAAAYRQALRDGAGDRQIEFNLGYALLQEGRTGDALEAFRRADDGGPGALAEASLFNRIVLLAEIGTAEELLEATAAFLDRFPDSEQRRDVELFEADALGRTGRAAEAAARYVALGRTVGGADVAVRAGYYLLAAGDDSGALQVLAPLATRHDDSQAGALASYLIGAVYTARNEHARSISYYDGAAVGADTGTAPLAALAAGVAAYAAGRPEEAGGRLATVSLLAPGTGLAGSAEMLRGQLAYRAGDLAAAATAFRTARNDFTTAGRPEAAAEARIRHAETVFRAGAYRHAADLFVEIALADATHADAAWYRAGLAERLAGRPHRAVPLLEAARRAADESVSVQAGYELVIVHADGADRSGLATADAALAWLQERYPDHELTVEAALAVADAAAAIGERERSVDLYSAVAAAAVGSPTGSLAARRAATALLPVAPERAGLAAWRFLVDYPDDPAFEAGIDLLRLAWPAGGGGVDLWALLDDPAVPPTVRRRVLWELARWTLARAQVLPEPARRYAGGPYACGAAADGLDATRRGWLTGISQALVDLPVAGSARDATAGAGSGGAGQPAAPECLPGQGSWLGAPDRSQRQLLAALLLAASGADDAAGVPLRTLAASISGYDPVAAVAALTAAWLIPADEPAAVVELLAVAARPGAPRDVVEHAYARAIELLQAGGDVDAARRVAERRDSAVDGGPQ